MKNPTLKIGQKVVTKLESFDYQTSAEFERFYRTNYGFISDVEIADELFDCEDGSKEMIRWITYRMVIIRSEIVRDITFDDGWQYENTVSHEVINFPMDYERFTNDIGDGFYFLRVDKFEFENEMSLFE